MPGKKQPKKKNSDKTEKAKQKRRLVKGADKDKRLANLIPFEPGQSGNPSGRPLGARDRRTVIWEAMKKIAEHQGMLPEDVEVEMQVSALKKAILKADFYMYQELSNGLYGKIVDNVDIKSGGKSLADLVAHAHVSGSRKRTKTTKKTSE